MMTIMVVIVMTLMLTIDNYDHDSDDENDYDDDNSGILKSLSRLKTKQKGNNSFTPLLRFAGILNSTARNGVRVFQLADSFLFSTTTL